MNTRSITARITAAFRTYTAAPSKKRFNPIPRKLTSGKLYEAFVLADVAKHLTTKEGLRLRLSAGKQLRLKSSPGPINRAYPHIDVIDSAGAVVAELWTDIEFTSLSYAQRGNAGVSPTRGEFHELDIAMVLPGMSGRPPHHALLMGVECKNTGYGKGLLKEILGIRRELSLLTSPRVTSFTQWPRSDVPADPPSCLVVYSTDAGVASYAAPGGVFGIDFFHLPM